MDTNKLRAEQLISTVRTAQLLSTRLIKDLMRSNAFLKSLFVSSFLAAGGSALAGGPADGAYFCNFSIPGLAPIQQYAVVTGKSDGTSVVVFPATQPSQAIYGYGVGFAGGGRFTGFSERGQPFDLSYVSANIAGTFGYVLNGKPVNASALCFRVF